MDHRPTSSSTILPNIAVTANALDRLTTLGWRGGLAALVAGLAASFFLFGYALVYWRNADMDFMVIYNALLLNDGKPQHFFDHTAYLTILSTQVWFRLLHGLGLLDAYSLSSIPSASDGAAFDAAMTSAVRAGRLLAWLTATGCVLIFAALIRRVIRDWRIALIATFAFAFSGAVAVHLRILRSELVAACPILFALLILMIAGRRGSIFRPLVMAAVATLCVLGLENKVQAILLIAALPLIILPFGDGSSASAPFWRNGVSAWLVAGVAAGIAALSVWTALPLLRVGYNQDLLQAAQLQPLFFGRYGIYQCALAGLIATCMLAYAVTWRISLLETLASMAAVTAGASIALLLLDVEYNSANVIAVLNPLEKMLAFADSNTTSVARGSNSWDILVLALGGIGSVLARYTFVLHSSPRPTVFLTWLIIPGVVLAWRRGAKQVSLQALLLLLAAIAIDSLGVRRGLKSEYFIFTDPLLVIAGAILLERMSDLRFHRWAFSVAATLAVLHIAVGQAEPVKFAFKRSGPEPICQWNRYYLPLLPLPWCQVPVAHP